MALNVKAAEERMQALEGQYRRIQAACNSTFPNPPAVKAYRYKRLYETIAELLHLSLDLRYQIKLKPTRYILKH